MEFDIDRVRANARTATSDDLLDRVTVYRSGLEPAALAVIFEELRSRGLDPEAIVRHEESRTGVLRDGTGAGRPCARCRRPAVVRVWGWHRVFGKLPVFPRVFYLCEEHRPRARPVERSSPAEH